MQCMQLLHWCALFAADVAVTLEAHLQSMPAAICCFLVQGGSQGSYPFTEKVHSPCTCTAQATHTHHAPSARVLT